MNVFDVIFAWTLFLITINYIVATALRTWITYSHRFEQDPPLCLSKLRLLGRYWLSFVLVLFFYIPVCFVMFFHLNFKVFFSQAWSHPQLKQLLIWHTPHFPVIQPEKLALTEIACNLYPSKVLAFPTCTARLSIIIHSATFFILSCFVCINFHCLLEAEEFDFVHYSRYSYF